MIKKIMSEFPNTESKILILKREDYYSWVKDYLDVKFIKRSSAKEIENSDLVLIQAHERVEIFKSRFHHESEELKEALATTGLKNTDRSIERYAERIKSQREASTLRDRGVILSYDQIKKMKHMLGLDNFIKKGTPIAYRNRWYNGKMAEKEFDALLGLEILGLKVDEQGGYWYWVTYNGIELLKLSIGDFYYDEF